MRLSRLLLVINIRFLYPGNNYQIRLFRLDYKRQKRNRSRASWYSVGFSFLLWHCLLCILCKKQWRKLNNFNVWLVLHRCHTGVQCSLLILCCIQYVYCWLPWHSTLWTLFLVSSYTIQQRYVSHFYKLHQDFNYNTIDL